MTLNTPTTLSHPPRAWARGGACRHGGAHGAVRFTTKLAVAGLCSYAIYTLYNQYQVSRRAATITGMPSESVAAASAGQESQSIPNLNIRDQ